MPAIMKTCTVTLSFNELVELLDDEHFEYFLDLLSQLHSNTTDLMNITWNNPTITLEVTGDVSEAIENENYQPAS